MTGEQRHEIDPLQIQLAVAANKSRRAREDEARAKKALNDYLDRLVEVVIAEGGFA